MVVAGEEAVILGTGEWLMGLEIPGSWMSRALGGTMLRRGRVVYWRGWRGWTLPGWTKNGAGGGAVQERPGTAPGPPIISGWTDGW